MKIKSGFTLAEVLITLAIIGVVATLTLPSLMTNTKEQQYVTALKKGINTLTNAGTLNSATDGFDYNDITAFGTGGTYYDSTTGAKKMDVAGIVGTNANVDTKKTSTTEIVFKDGTSILAGTANSCVAIPAEGITAVVPIMFDANGPQAPNKYFECSATSVDGCNDKSKRIAGDRFAICVGGTSAFPANPATETNQSRAAQWAYYGGKGGTATATTSGS